MARKKLNEEQSLEVVKRYIINGERAADLAKEFGCSGWTIYKAINAADIKGVAKDESKILREQLNDALEALATIQKKVKELSDTINSIL